MDIKVLLLGLLFIIVNVFPAYAGPVTDAEETFVKREPSNEKYQSELLENKIDIAMAYVKKQTIKARELKSNAEVYSKITNDRYKYSIEYKKLAEDIKEKARNAQEKASVEAASLDGVENTRKEWESKSREAEVNAKNWETEMQKLHILAQELSKKIDAFIAAAALAEAEATAYENIANKERNWSFELKSKAEELQMEAARNHFTKSKEAEQRAHTDKIKAQQFSEEAQTHLQAAKALADQIHKAEAASMNNLARYIALSIQAEEAANMLKEEELRAIMEEMLHNELNKRAETVKGIIKIFKKECEYYKEKAMKHSSEADMYSKSAQAVGNEFISHGASMLKLATAKEDGEIEHDEETFSGQKLKTMPFVAQKIID